MTMIIEPMMTMVTLINKTIMLIVILLHAGGAVQSGKNAKEQYLHGGGQA